MPALLPASTAGPIWESRLPERRAPALRGFYLRASPVRAELEFRAPPHPQCLPGVKFQNSGSSFERAPELVRGGSRFFPNHALAEIAEAFAASSFLLEAAQQDAKLAQQVLTLDDVLVEAVQPRAGFIAAEIKL